MAKPEKNYSKHKIIFMKTKIIFQSVIILLSSLFFISCHQDNPVPCIASNNAVVTSKVFATGLNNPRSLKFGPDGYLYVAEGGLGGTNPAGECDPVLPPVGPYTGSNDGSRISKINHAGVVTTVVDHLPSSQTAATQGSLVSGVGDISFIGNTLYAVLSGAGCSHGVVSIPNGVIKIAPNGTWSMIANLSEYQMSHPVANPEPDDFEPDGTWYSMINVGGNLFAVEPNHGELDKITTNGHISRVADISATQGHIVPTVVAFHNGNFYVGNLNVFPAANNSSIYKITPSGQVSVFATGFNMILGVAFDQLGGLYVLENTTGNPFPTPGTGDIVRVDPSGSRRVIITGLNLPTGITFGPDNKLYVSNWGFGPPAIGGGEILQISFDCDQLKGVVAN